MSEIEKQIHRELRVALSRDAEALHKFLIKYDADVEFRVDVKTLYAEFNSPNFHFIMEV